MTEEQILEKFQGICEKVVVVTPTQIEKLEKHHDLIEDLGFDSLDQIEAILAVEQEFSISILDDEAEKLQTVGDAIKCIKGKIK